MTQYTDGVVAGMQMLYGEGFLSPGGASEVPDLVDGVEITGKSVLDIGCGLGGLAMMLVREFDCGQVTAIDIESDLIARARSAVAAAGLQNRVAARCIEPGKLPFDDASFDIAVTKDVVCHVENKAAIFAEIRRILKPGGKLLLADFFDNRAQAGENAASLFDAYVAGMSAYGLNFHFQPFDTYREALTAGGLAINRHRDHTAASAAIAAREHDILSGTDADAIRAALGPDRFKARCEATEMRMRALEARGLLHGHVVAVKTA
ncbi:MAG: class I SAM-dependent methyltransferase [Rhodospirillales bacterium]